jgi:hypothetical protein
MSLMGNALLDKFGEVYPLTGGQEVLMPLIETADGWTETVVGTGSITQRQSDVILYTGTNANSSAKLVVECAFLFDGFNWQRIDFSKRFIIKFSIMKAGDDSECVTNIFFSDDTTPPLSEKGVGVKIDNLTLKGICYDSQLRTSGTLATLSGLYAKLIKIDFVPGTGAKFYVDGTLVETLANIPTGQTTNPCDLTIKIENGATGTVNNYIAVSPITIWKEIASQV